MNCIIFVTDRQSERLGEKQQRASIKRKQTKWNKRKQLWSRHWTNYAYFVRNRIFIMTLYFTRQKRRNKLNWNEKEREKLWIKSLAISLYIYTHNYIPIYIHQKNEEKQQKSIYRNWNWLFKIKSKQNKWIKSAFENELWAGDVYTF